MRTPVSRVGNKTSVLHILYALFPLEYSRFVDVFGGSGSVLLGQATEAPFEVYNDFDRDLVNLFRCMRDRNFAFLQELGFHAINARDDFDVWKQIIQGNMEDIANRYMKEELELTEIMLQPATAQEARQLLLSRAEDYDVRRAATFFKLQRFSYASKGKSFAGVPFDLGKISELIRQTEKRLKNVVIENQDFQTLIEHYDRKETFFYLDPPYLDTEHMYDVPFDWKDHLRLRETLGKIQGRFLLSYNDCPEIRKIYKGYAMFDFKRDHPMTHQFKKGEQYPELLIGNYDIYERERARPVQLDLFGMADNGEFVYEKVLKERIISRKK